MKEKRITVRLDNETLADLHKVSVARDVNISKLVSGYISHCLSIEKLKSECRELFTLSYTRKDTAIIPGIIKEMTDKGLPYDVIKRIHIEVKVNFEV